MMPAWAAPSSLSPEKLTRSTPWASDQAAVCSPEPTPAAARSTKEPEPWSS